MESFVIKTFIKLFLDTCQVLQLKAIVTVRPFRADQTFAGLERLHTEKDSNKICQKISVASIFSDKYFNLKNNYYFIQIRNINKISIFILLQEFFC